MKALGSILICLLLAAESASAAQPTTLPVIPTQEMLIQRANADAVSALYAQVAAESVGGMAVAQIIDRVEGHTILINGLAKAEQVGGPRVVAEDLVQVQLQINGSRAAQLVLQAATVKPEKSPIAPDRLATLLQDWNGRVFTSTGASLPPAEGAGRMLMMSATRATLPSTLPRIAELKLEVVPDWAANPLVASATAERSVSPLRTARTAEQAARELLRTKIEALEIETGLKLGDIAQGDEMLRYTIDDAVDAAKIAGVDYRSNGSVEVRIALDGRQLWQAILASR